MNARKGATGIRWFLFACSYVEKVIYIFFIVL